MDNAGKNQKLIEAPQQTAKKQIFTEAVNLPWTFPYGPKDSLAFDYSLAKEFLTKAVDKFPRSIIPAF